MVLLLLLSSAVFKIRSVSVEDQTRLTYLNKSMLNDMIQNAELPIGSSIFFARFDDNVKAMEKAHPYVKINDIERKFPGDVVVYVSERVPVVKIKSGAKTFVLDSDLKILNVAENNVGFITETAEQDVPELILGNNLKMNIDFSALSAGDFIVGQDKLKEYVWSFYHGAVFSANGSPEALSCITTLNSITIDYVPELEKVAFYIDYKGTTITSTIEGETELVEVIYKVVTAVRERSSYSNVDYINSKDGIIYEGKIL